MTSSTEYSRFARTMLAFGLLMAGAHGLVAQSRANTTYDRARALLPVAQRAEFARIVNDAKARGLPTDPLIDKVLEGAAKSQPPTRILSVVRQRAGLLTRAKGLVGTRPSTELVTVADALQRGLSDQAIRQVRAGARSNEPIGLALHTYADLADRGVSSDVALRMINSWRTRGAAAGDMRELPMSVDRLVRSGANPVRAGSAVADALRTGRGAGTVKMDAKLRGPPPVDVTPGDTRKKAPAAEGRSNDAGTAASDSRKLKE